MKAATLRAVDADRKPLPGMTPSMREVATFLLEYEQERWREVGEYRGFADAIRRAVGLPEGSDLDEIQAAVERLAASVPR